MNFQELQTRSAAEVDSTSRKIDRLHKHLDLAELINAHLEYKERQINQRAVNAFYELSESVRAYHGEHPNGIYVPLGALSRDLLTSNSSTLVTGALTSTYAAGLLPASGLIGRGATVISGLTNGTVSIPVIDPAADTSGLWLGSETTAAPQREPGFKLATVTPHAIAIQMIVTRGLMRDARVNLDQLIRRHISDRLSLAIDAAAINGSGTNEPLGVLGNAGLEIVSAGTNGAAPTWSHIVELESRVSARVGTSAQSPAFLMGPNLAKKLRTTQRASGADFIMPGDGLIDRPALVSSNVPENLTKGTASGTCGALLYGDLAEIVVGFWGPFAIDLVIDTVTRAKSAQIVITARADIGVAVRQPGAFAAYKDLVVA